jgi:predicted  nucleic acid-binding Zn-ribbon protein
MDEKSLWQQLKTVADCDKKIATINDDINHLLDGITKDSQQDTQQHALLHAKQHVLMQAQKELQLKELNIKELKDGEDKKRAHLDKVKNQKEYHALETEIENLSRQRSKLEDEVLKNLYAIDTLKNEVEEVTKGSTEKIAILEHDQQIKKDNLEHLKIKRDQALLERETAIQAVPLEWRTQYERMHQTVADPIVPALNGSCSACYYAILHQDLAKLKKEQVVVCRSCYRFLYYDKNESQEAKKADY